MCLFGSSQEGCSEEWTSAVMWVSVSSITLNSVVFVLTSLALCCFRHIHRESEQQAPERAVGVIALSMDDEDEVGRGLASSGSASRSWLALLRKGSSGLLLSKTSSALLESANSELPVYSKGMDRHRTALTRHSTAQSGFSDLVDEAASESSEAEDTSPPAPLVSCCSRDNLVVLALWACCLAKLLADILGLLPPVEMPGQRAAIRLLWTTHALAGFGIFVNQVVFVLLVLQSASQHAEGERAGVLHARLVMVGYVAVCLSHFALDGADLVYGGLLHIGPLSASEREWGVRLSTWRYYTWALECLGLWVVFMGATRQMRSLLSQFMTRTNVKKQEEVTLALTMAEYRSSSFRTSTHRLRTQQISVLKAVSNRLAVTSSTDMACSQTLMAALQRSQLSGSSTPTRKFALLDETDTASAAESLAPDATRASRTCSSCCSWDSERVANNLWLKLQRTVSDEVTKLMPSDATVLAFRSAPIADIFATFDSRLEDLATAGRNLRVVATGMGILWPVVTITCILVAAVGPVTEDQISIFVVFHGLLGAVPAIIAATLWSSLLSKSCSFRCRSSDSHKTYPVDNAIRVEPAGTAGLP
jgi:hypothetical protein